MYGERGDGGGLDDPPDGKRSAQLPSAIFEFIAEERRRQRCIHKTGGDEVDADRRELERQAGCEGHCGGDGRRGP